jgi:hypothetical protein
MGTTDILGVIKRYQRFSLTSHRTACYTIIEVPSELLEGDLLVLLVAPLLVLPL